MPDNILIIDDDRSLASVLKKALGNARTEIDCVYSLSEAWIQISKINYDIIITDVMLPDGDGLELVKKIIKKFSFIKIIVISAKNNLLTAVKASELGVFEYLPKPLDLNDLTIVVHRALIKTSKKKEKEYFDDEKLPIIGTSAPMQSIYRTIAKLMKTDLTVLITGETGTGKELVAKAIHDFSSRSKENFVVLNMAAIPKNLIESELFGYEKGAFTGAENRKLGFFEKASSGTIFLDEIGDMPFDVQARLLRILQFGEYTRVGGVEVIKSDVRIIAATNVNLKQSVENGYFREDLYYRLNVVNIEMPPLRSRVEDIIVLAEHFLKKYSDTKKFHKNCFQSLENHKWPGNVRELENFVNKLTIFYSEDLITENIVKKELKGLNSEKSQKESHSSSLSESISSHFETFFKALDKNPENLDLYKNLLSEFEKPLIIKTLEFCDGNQIKASKILGLNRNTLRKKINNLKIKI